MANPIDYSKWDNLDEGGEENLAQELESKSSISPDQPKAPSTPTPTPSAGSSSEPKPNPNPGLQALLALIREKGITWAEVREYHRHFYTSSNLVDLRPKLPAFWADVDTLSRHSALQVSELPPTGSLLTSFYEIVKGIYSSQQRYLPIVMEAMTFVMCQKEDPSTIIYRDDILLAEKLPNLFIEDRAFTPVVTCVPLVCLAHSLDKASFLKFVGWDAEKVADLSAGSANLSEVLKRTRTELKNSASDDMTLLHVDLTDERWMNQFMGISAAAAEMPFHYVNNHACIIAANRHGVRIFQSFFFSHGAPVNYNLAQWIDRGGAKLRSWTEIILWARHFSKLNKHAPEITPEISAAWAHCFGVEILPCILLSRARTYKPYKPFVRVYEIKDIRPEYLTKFVWKFNEYRNPVIKSLLTKLIA